MSNAIHPMQTGNNIKQGQKKTPRKKVNPLKNQKEIDYLDSKFLQRFTNDQGKLLPRRITGISAYQQRRVAKAIKYARHLALLPFVAQDVT